MGLGHDLTFCASLHRRRRRPTNPPLCTRPGSPLQPRSAKWPAKKCVVTLEVQHSQDRLRYSWSEQAVYEPEGYGVNAPNQVATGHKITQTFTEVALRKASALLATTWCQDLDPSAETNRVLICRTAAKHSSGVRPRAFFG